MGQYPARPAQDKSDRLRYSARDRFAEPELLTQTEEKRGAKDVRFSKPETCDVALDFALDPVIENRRGGMGRQKAGHDEEE